MGKSLIDTLIATMLSIEISFYGLFLTF
jgi:hypothetical protein